MSGSGGSTPKSKHFDEEDKQNIDAGYPNYTVLHSYEGVANHKEKAYIRTLLVFRENTEYLPETDQNYEVCYIIPAQVMVQVIISNRYEVIVPDKTKPRNRILCPASVQDMYDAEDEVKKYARNAKIGTYLRKFPSIPMQHNLPEVRMLEEDHTFKEWKPPPPTQADWRAFIYAPTNIRYKKVTYAANCRHKTGAWDEHPWCAACLVAAKIKVCVHPDERKEGDEPCYICDTMTPEAIRSFLNKIKNWNKPDEKGKNRKPKGRKLPTRIKCQVHADLANAPEAQNDLNPAWAKKKPGICRPATTVPMYAVIEDFLKWSPSQRASSAKRHMQLYKNRYYEDRNHYGVDCPEWPSLKTFEIMGSKTFVDDEEGDEDEEVVVHDEQESAEDEEEVSAEEKLEKSKSSQSAPNSPKKKKRPTKRTKPKETKLQRMQRLLREKDGELLLARSELKKLKKEMQELRQQKVSATSKSAKWKANSLCCTMPQSNHYRSYNYKRALQAAARMAPEEVKFEVQHEPAEKRRKIMHRSLLSTKRSTFVPDEDILKKIDKTLDEYAENPFQPEFEVCIDLCMADFTPSNILSEPPNAEPDMHGKRPTDDDEVMLTQREILRLESLNRAMVKIHETDEAFLSAMLANMDISKLGEPTDEPDEVVVLEAMRQNQLRKEDLLAEATAITIATRRRDNVMRQNVEEPHRTAILAHALLPKETSLLMRTMLTTQGAGPSHSRQLQGGTSQQQ